MSKRFFDRLLSRNKSSKATRKASSTPPSFERIADKFRSLEEVREELRRNGLESSNLIVGVDFTKSNEWTGRISFQGRSLHTIGPVPNPYEEAIRTICKTLEFCDEDNQIPCYGFGDATTHDKDVFAFFTGDQPSPGLDAALQQYRELAPNVKLAGPTSFAPLIRQAIRIVVESGMQYHILLIVADGQVTRSVDTPEGAWSTQESATIEALVDASKVPLSIIMVGVGDGPWDMMEEFDDKLPQRDFDNFQFVNFTEITMQTRTSPLERREAMFALHALMEIPEQYKTIVNTNLLGGQAPQLKITAPPLPPPLPRHMAPSRTPSLPLTTASNPYGNSSRSTASYPGYEHSEEAWDNSESQHPLLGPPGQGQVKQYRESHEASDFVRVGPVPAMLVRGESLQTSLSNSSNYQQPSSHNYWAVRPPPSVLPGQQWLNRSQAYDKENDSASTSEFNFATPRGYHHGRSSVSSISLKPSVSNASATQQQLLDSVSSALNASSAGPVTLPSSPSLEASKLKMFVCPLTKEIMRDPVIAADGYTYEHTAIDAWLASSNLSPMTKQPLQHKLCIPNNLLKSAIIDHVDNQLPGQPPSPRGSTLEACTAPPSPRPAPPMPQEKTTESRPPRPQKRETVLDSVQLLGDASASTYNTPFVTSLYSPFVFDGGEASVNLDRMETVDRLPSIPRRPSAKPSHTLLSFLGANTEDDFDSFHDCNSESFVDSDLLSTFEGFKVAR